MTEPYPVIGIEDTGVQTRLELHDLMAKPVQFSLFIRALNRIHDMRNTDDQQSSSYIDNPNSWWQMGGIHGLPYTRWSGDPTGPEEPDSNAAWQGYCYHGSTLFPTWHRVLLLLVEQAVVNEAIAIATEIEANEANVEGEKWLDAAKQLRFPFWDWTRRTTAKIGIPVICREPVIAIANPGGSYIRVPNPLNHYKFTLKPGATEGVEYMNDWGRTYRWANQDENPTEELYDQATKAFAEGGILSFGGGEVILESVSWLREKVASLFTYDLTLEDSSYGPNMWGYFSSTGASSIYAPMTKMPSSIEEPHNKVHLDTGGNGSMSVNEYAGFDPIFFLHHCNVDRLYAFWEYLYPDYWMESGWTSSAGETVSFVTTDGSYYQDSGASIDHTTSLEPFRTKSLEYWNSDDTRGLLDTSLMNKYYTYPPIKDLRTGVEVQVDSPYDVNDLSLREQYQQALYNEWGLDLSTIVQTHRAVSSHLPQHLSLLLKEDDDLSHLRHFVAIGEVPEFTFPGSYRLEIYLSPEDPQRGPIILLNSVSVLARADPDKCPGCRDRRAAGTHVRGYMHVDPHIILYLLTQLDPTRLSKITALDHLAVLIKESLGMRLVKPDGTRLAVFKPSVGSSNVPLEPAKTPRVTLYSHVISFKPTDASVPIKFRDHMNHGVLDGGGWETL